MYKFVIVFWTQHKGNVRSKPSKILKSPTIQGFTLYVVRCTHFSSKFVHKISHNQMNEIQIRFWRLVWGVETYIGRVLWIFMWPISTGWKNTCRMGILSELHYRINPRTFVHRNDGQFRGRTGKKPVHPRSNVRYPIIAIVCMFLPIPSSSSSFSFSLPLPLPLFLIFGLFTKGRGVVEKKTFQFLLMHTNGMAKWKIKYTNCRAKWIIYVLI